MKLRYTRAMLNAALYGRLNGVPLEPHPVFGVAVPEVVPRRSRAHSWMRAACGPTRPPTIARRRDLAARFNKNFEKFSGVSKEIAAAAPGM